MRTHYAKNKTARNKRAERFARMRAAKERIRIERLTAEIPLPDSSGCYVPKVKPSGFRVSIACLDDGERVSFITHRGPFGLTISPTTCARRVAMILKNYSPIKK